MTHPVIDDIDRMQQLRRMVPFISAKLEFDNGAIAQHIELRRVQFGFLLHQFLNNQFEWRPWATNCNYCSNLLEIDLIKMIIPLHWNQAEVNLQYLACPTGFWLRFEMWFELPSMQLME